MGWVGSRSQLDYALATFGADRDEEGRFEISGGVSSFMGAGEDMLVDDTAMYYVNGQPHSIVGALGLTSYGTRIHVIGEGDDSNF